MADMHTHVLGQQATTSIPNIKFIEAEADMPETSMRAPKFGPIRSQLKDLKPPKFNGNAATCSLDAIEKWLSKWEQCF